MLLVGWRRRLLYFSVVTGGTFARSALLSFCHMCSTFSLSFFDVLQILFSHFNGLGVQRLFGGGLLTQVWYMKQNKVLFSTYSDVRDLKMKNGFLKPGTKLNISLN